MPPLPNKRHENIAVHIADGLSLRVASAREGYSTTPDDNGVTQIRRRAEEIQAERQSIVAAQTAQTISAALMSREDLWRDIRDLISEAKGKGDLSVAMRGLELLGKDIGMFVQRIQSTNEHTINDLKDNSAVRAELDDILGSAVTASDDEDGGGGVVQGEDPGGAATRH